MNAYEKSIQLGISQNENKIEILSSLTSYDIPCVGPYSVATWLRETLATPVIGGNKAPLLMYDGLAYYGLIQSYAEVGDNPDLLSGIVQLKSSIWGNGAPVLYTTSVDWSVFIKQIVFGIVQLVKEEERESLIHSFYALGGGRLYPNLTEGEFDDLVLEKEQAELRNDAYNLMIAKVNSVIGAISIARDSKLSPEDIIQAGNDAWNK